MDSPCGNSPISREDDSPPLSLLELLGDGGGGLLDGEDGELLELDELLLEELEDGGDELGGAELGVPGIDGGCCLDWLLGQAVRIRQVKTSPVSLASVGSDMPLLLLYDFIGSENLLRNNWFSTDEAGPEFRLAQFSH